MLLDDVVVLELGAMYAAPTAGRVLRDFGARVLKVEVPGAGDNARQWSPQHNGIGLGFARLNTGKESIAIDLRTSAGRELVLEMALRVDVLIESFRPGRLEAWDLGPDRLHALNEELVVVRVSGFGQTGPYSDRPGFGTVAETASGFGYLNGWPDRPPTAPPFGFADSIAGITAAFGTAMALYDRARSGRGRVIDVALYEPLMFILGDAVLNYSLSGRVMERQGNRSSASSPRGIYQSSDGAWLSISASAQSIAMRLFDAIGRPDLKEVERFSTNSLRLRHDAELQEIIADWVAARTRDVALAELERQEVVCAPVNDARDIVRDPHFMHRTLQHLTSEALGDGVIPGPVLHAEGYPTPVYDGVPEVGEHTVSVLSEMLNVDERRLEALVAAGAIPQAALEVRTS